MAEQLVLISEKNPTVFNKTALMGMAIGALAAGGLAAGGFIPVTAVASLVGLGETASIAAVAGAGALLAGGLGGIVGKTFMKREFTVGKKVKDTSFLNKDTLLGALLAGTVALATSVGLASYFPEVNAFLSPGASITAIPGLGTVGLAIAAGATALGGLIGGISGSIRMEREYCEAQRQHVIQHISKNISPDIGEAVEYAIHPNKQWVQNVLHEKLSAIGSHEPQR